MIFIYDIYLRMIFIYAIYLCYLFIPFIYPIYLIININSQQNSSSSLYILHLSQLAKSYNFSKSKLKSDKFAKQIFSAKNK